MKLRIFKIILLLFLIFNLHNAFGETTALDKVKKLINSGKIYEAETILVESVKAGDKEGIRFYAICLIKGQYFNKNIPKAIAVLKEGAKYGDKKSQLRVM